MEGGGRVKSHVIFFHELHRLKVCSFRVSYRKYSLSSFRQEIKVTYFYFLSKTGKISHQESRHNTKLSILCRISKFDFASYLGERGSKKISKIT